MTKLRLGILISGGGTTARSILDACKNGELKGIDPVCIISSNHNAGGIKKVIDLGFDSKNIHVLERNNYDSSEEFGKAMLDIFQTYNVELIGQYGWLILTPKNVIKVFEGRIINQHPGPLEFGRIGFGGKGWYGRRVHRARLIFVKKTRRAFYTEATAHLAYEKFDEGPVIKLKRIPIYPDDTVETLQKRILPIEHEVQIAALRDFANGTVTEYTEREETLVRQEEVSIFEKARDIAFQEYPNG